MRPLAFSTPNTQSARCRRLTGARLVLLLLTSFGMLTTGSGCTAYSHCREWLDNGCKVGPNYCQPAAPVAEDWIDADDQRVSSQPAQTTDWWLAFGDPVLNSLVQTASAQNLSLRGAGMRILQARAQRGVAAGNLFPQSQNINGSYARNQLSTTAANTPPGVLRTFDNWAMSGDLLWELDFWGRFRRAVEAADADLDASVESYDDVLVCLIAEVAATYTNIRTLQQRLDYARKNVEIQKGSLNIADVQFRNGAVTEVDVQQAKLNVTSTEALIPQFQAALRQQNNLLCFLLGEPPRDLTPLLGDGKIPVPPMEVALGIPCELLRRRPDVRRAERQVAAQSALIGVAVSDFYPHLQIRGSIGYQAQNLSRLFVPASNTGLIAPGFSWDVLNYGRIQNNVQVQRAAFQALALAYQNTVLQANQEVENGVTTFLNSQDQTLVLNESVEAAERSLELTLAQYRNGAVDFNRVFTIQNTQVAQQDSYAASQGNVALGLIQIYKALGGGWEIRLGAGQGMALPPTEQLQPGVIEPTPAGDQQVPAPAPPPVPAPPSLPPVPKLGSWFGADMAARPLGSGDLELSPLTQFTSSIKSATER